MARKTNAQRNREFHQRKRERMTQVQDLSAEMLRHELFSGIQISVEPTKWGTLEVTYDMGKDTHDTHAVLEAYCTQKGLQLDDILSDAIQESLNRYTKQREQLDVMHASRRKIARKIMRNLFLIYAMKFEQAGLTVQVDVVGKQDRIRLSGKPSDTLIKEIRADCLRDGFDFRFMMKGITAQMADNEVLRQNAR